MSVRIPKVTTIVLTWNSADFIEACLDSLLASSYKTNVLVIDNGSTDQTRELVSGKFPKLKLVNTGSNLGYAGGNNFGLNLSEYDSSDYIFIINPDATIDQDCITFLVERMEQEREVAICSPMIYYRDSRKIWYIGSKINWKNGTTYHTNGNQIDKGQFDTESYTERINGCAVLIRKTAMDKVGLMDDNYFLYYEETDWSVRFALAGYKIGLVPRAKAWHAVSSSTGGGQAFVYQYYITRNRLYFMHKFHKLHPTHFFRVRNRLGSCLELLIILKNHGFKVFWRAVRARRKAYSDYSHSRLGRQPIV